MRSLVAEFLLAYMPFSQIAFSAGRIFSLHAHHILRELGVTGMLVHLGWLSMALGAAAEGGVLLLRALTRGDRRPHRP